MAIRHPNVCSPFAASLSGREPSNTAKVNMIKTFELINAQRAVPIKSTSKIVYELSPHNVGALNPLKI